MKSRTELIQLKKKLKDRKRAEATAHRQKVLDQLEDLTTKLNSYSGNNEDFVNATLNNLQHIADQVSTIELKSPEVSVNVPDVNVPDIKIPEIRVPEIKAPVVNVPEPTVIKEDDVFSKYKPADVIKDNNTTYYGYLSKTGEWFIMREIKSTNGAKYRYSSGKKGYDFTKRSKLKYYYFNQVGL